MSTMEALMINYDDINIQAHDHFLAGEGSSFAKRETANVSKKWASRSNKVEPTPSVVDKTNAEEDNTKEVPSRFKINEPEIKAEQTEHFRQFEKNLNFVCFWGKLLGLELNYEWKKMTSKYAFAIFVMVYTWSNILYTQCLHIKNRDYKGLFEVFAIYGIGIGGVLTMGVNFIYNKNITALMHFTRKICLQNRTATRSAILKSGLTKIHSFNVVFATCGISCVGLYAGYPVKALLMDGKYVSIMPIEIMFIDQSTTIGFFSANAIMVAMGIWTLQALLYVNLCLIITISNYSIQVDMVEEDIKELNNYWSGAKVPFKGYQQMLLRNICQKKQDMDSYINEIKKIYDGYIFYFFVASYVTQVICMFEIVTNNWISGYGIAFGVFLCQMGYCIMGTKLITQNDRLINHIHQFKWYECDMRSKKIYLQLLISTMNTKELWIGPLAGLNVVTGIQIVKSMYSYYTLLMKVV